MNVSSRTRLILELLLKSDRDLTAAEIAAEVHVSARTVHRELSAAEDILRSQGIKLLKKSGSGIRLQGDKERLERLHDIVSASEDIEFSPDERQTYLLCLLLEFDEPVKLFTLARELKVTLPTVGSDLDELSGWVRKLGVTVVRRRGYGVEISGQEDRLRRTIRHVIKLRLDDSELIASRVERPLHPLDRELFALAGKEDMEDVESVLWKWEEHWTGRLSENAYTDLLIRISIALRRIRAGKTITVMENSNSLSAQDESDSLRLTELLSRQMDVRFDAGEIAYVAHLLGSARMQDAAPLPGDDIQLAETVRALIRHVDNAARAGFTEDRSLRDGLFSHLKASIQRLNDELRIRNPLLDQIRRDYYGLFGIVREAVNQVIPELHVPDEEIGFLVMHFGASQERLKQLRRQVRAILVCTSGIGSSKLLQIRVEKEFPQIEIVNRVSWYEASRISEDQYDLVVSTIDLPLDPSQYIKVSPLLTQGEADRLRSFIKETTLSRKFEGTSMDAEKAPGPAGLGKLLSLKKTLDEILKLIERFKIIRIGENSGDLSAILEEACRYEEQAGVITDAGLVTKRLMEREYSGSQMIPGTALALFHTRGTEISQPSLSLFRLPNPLPVETLPPARLSRFLLMLAPQILSQESLEVLSEISAMLLDDAMIELLEAADDTAIRNYLTTHLKSFFRNKTESE